MVSKAARTIIAIIMLIIGLVVFFFLYLRLTMPPLPIT